MCGYYADIAGTQFHRLHLAWRPPWEGYHIGSKAAETSGIVGSLKHRQLLGRDRKGIYMHAVLQSDNDTRLGRSREADAVDWGAKFEAEDGLMFYVIPDNDL